MILFPKQLLFVTLIFQIGVKFCKPTSLFENDDLKNIRETYSLKMKSYMNTSIDPCDDFYEYSCGNFPNAIDEHYATGRRLGIYDITYVLNDLIDKLLAKERDSNEKYYNELQEVKKFIKSCDNANLYPVEPSHEYLNVINSIGGFPALDPLWDPSTFEWTIMAGHLTRYGISVIVEENFIAIYPFPPIYKVSKFGFGFNVYLENIKTKDSKGYVYNAKVMRELLGIYGVTGEKAEHIIDDIVEFWRLILLKPLLLLDGKCKTLDILSNSYFGKWHSFLNVAWNVKRYRLDYYSQCPCHWYFNKLDSIAKERPEAFANYMALKFLFRMHGELTSKSLQHEYCLDVSKHSMALVLSHFYMKDYFNEQIREDVYKIVAEMRNSSQHLIEQSDWMDEPTRAEALLKIKSLSCYVGERTDPITDNLIKLLKNVNITDNYPTNNLKLSKFKVDIDHYAYLHPEIDRNTKPLQLLNPIEINAFYFSIENSINVMAGVLHPPVYHQNFPNSVKYGAFGHVIGHELGHSLTNKGANVDSKLIGRNWWSKITENNFKEKVKCFDQHYSDYNLTEIDYDIVGKKFQSENIADNAGLRASLDAYRKIYNAALKNERYEWLQSEVMPGLDLDPDQTFFLSFAQVYCSKYETKHYWLSMSDAHPLDRYRVIGTLQNFDEFSKVFKCPLDSPMNPSKKCQLW